MAKAAAKIAAPAAEPTETSEAEAAVAEVIPAPLKEAATENDSVFQAHVIRQANHHNDLAPSLAKRAREDKEREELLQEHEIIAERNRKEREAQKLEQDKREALENADANIARLTEEIANLQATIDGKAAELEAVKKLKEA